MVKLLARLLFLTLLFLVGVCGLLLSCQSSLIYFPHKYSANHRDALRELGGVPLRYLTTQGEQAAFYVPAQDSAAPSGKIWLCFGGNGSLALHWLPHILDWDRRFAYLLIDYPGYGDCAGRPSPGSIRESIRMAATALEQHLHLTRQQAQPRYAVLGHSLGSAAGLIAADELDIKSVVLVAPFTTLTDMGMRVVGWPLCHLNLHPFDNRATLRRVAEKGAKVSIFHGTDDAVIPIAMSRELAARHAARTTLHEMLGMDHNGIISDASREIGAAMLQVTQ